MTGGGWNVIDLGTNVENEKFVNAVNNHEGAIVGMSALLTTTMLNMELVAKELHKTSPGTRIFIGGAPVSQSYSEEIGAEACFRDPYSLVRHLNEDK